MSVSSDEQLLVQARAGDRAALEALLLRHQAEVYRFGMKMCRDPEDAKDVLQDTLLALARGVRDFRGASSLSTWLYTVTRSFCIKKRRKRKHAPVHVDSIEHTTALADDAPAPDERVATREAQHAVEKAIASLEPMYREVLLLRDVEGLTAPEVSEVLGLSIQAVKSRLHRARMAVRENLAPLLGAVAPAAADCPDVLMMYSRHLEDDMSPELCARMEHHVASCPRCQGACDSLKSSLALCRASAPATHVPRAVQASVKSALHSLLAEHPKP